MKEESHVGSFQTSCYIGNDRRDVPFVEWLRR
jgi:hypothetical protein